jgi:hypothetical protein
MDLKKLYERVKRMKTDMLMEEPCSLYEPRWGDVSNSSDDWEDFWYNEESS